MPGGLVTIGEVHTGLLLNSGPVSSAVAGTLLELTLGERVRRFDRPIAHARSPDLLTGFDCALPTSSGAKVRAVGTAISRAAITGGHLLQGSTFVTVVRSRAERRLPWSHYLARPGLAESLGKVEPKTVVDGFLDGKSPTGHLDLGAVSRRTMDTVQIKAELDHKAAFRSSRTKLRWVVTTTDSTRRSITFAVRSDLTRTVRLPHRDLAVTALVELCEDLALHDWLLTTLLSLINRSRIGSGSRSEVIDRLRPAIDYLLHLWMPAARIDPGLTQLWQALEQRPGFSRQWQVNVDRVRDQLAIGTIEKLGAAGKTGG